MPKAKIGIVEDDVAIANMYRIKFEKEGYLVETAGDGAIGFEMVKAFQPDILLLDLMMPEMNGDQVLAKIRQEDFGKDMPVIILTNLGEQEAPDSLKALDVTSYIVKAEMTPSQVALHIKEKLAEFGKE